MWRTSNHRSRALGRLFILLSLAKATCVEQGCIAIVSIKMAIYACSLCCNCALDLSHGLERGLAWPVSAPGRANGNLPRNPPGMSVFLMVCVVAEQVQASKGPSKG